MMFLLYLLLVVVAYASRFNHFHYHQMNPYLQKSHWHFPRSSWHHHHKSFLRIGCFVYSQKVAKVLVPTHVKRCPFKCMRVCKSKGFHFFAIKQGACSCVKCSHTAMKSVDARCVHGQGSSHSISLYKVLFHAKWNNFHKHHMKCHFSKKEWAAHTNYWKSRSPVYHNLYHWHKHHWKCRQKKACMKAQMNYAKCLLQNCHVKKNHAKCKACQTSTSYFGKMVLVCEKAFFHHNVCAKAATETGLCLNTCLLMKKDLKQCLRKDCTHVVHHYAINKCISGLAHMAKLMRRWKKYHHHEKNLLTEPEIIVDSFPVKEHFKLIGCFQLGSHFHHHRHHHHHHHHHHYHHHHHHHRYHHHHHKKKVGSVAECSRFCEKDQFAYFGMSHNMMCHCMRCYYHATRHGRRAKCSSHGAVTIYRNTDVKFGWKMAMYFLRRHWMCALMVVFVMTMLCTLCCCMCCKKGPKSQYPSQGIRVDDEEPSLSEGNKTTRLVTA